MKGTYLGEFEEVILLMVTIFDGKAYGNNLKMEFESRTDRSVNLSAIHAALYRLEHRAPYDCNYCLVTGWADYLMARCNGFRHLESLISRVTGAIPRDDDRRWLKEYLGAHGEESNPAP